MTDTFDPAAFEPQALLDSPGVMLAFGLSPATAEALAVEGGEPVGQLHLTVLYLGAITDWPSERLEVLRAAVRAFALTRFPLAGTTTGQGFLVLDGDEAAAVALADVPGLARFRVELEEHLAEYGIASPSAHDFLAHITVAYGPLDTLKELPVPGTLPLEFDTLLVCAGPEVDRVPLDGLTLAAAHQGDDPVYASIVKADDERRFTLSPLYVPEIHDSHGERVAAADLQDAVWDYVRTGDRTINLQHLPGTVAGEVVEIVSWPFEVEAELVTGDGTVKKVTLPPGTVYQGVVWEPFAWELVKAGRIRGLSMEGWAYRQPEED